MTCIKWLSGVALGLLTAGAIYLLVPDRKSPAAAPPASSLEVHLSARARAMRPGEAVLLTVETSRDADLVQGGAFGSDIPFWSTTGLRRWQGLVSIPRGTPAGSRTLPVQVTTADGAIATDTLTLRIEPELQGPAQGTVAATAVTTAVTSAATGFARTASATSEALSTAALSTEAQTLEDLLTTTRPGRLWSGPWREPLALTGAGVTVKAPNAGEIVMVATRRSSGLTIVIEHGEGLYSLFDHLSRSHVAAGARVAPGDVIGASAAASATRWLARLHNEAVDPQSLVYAAGGADDGSPRAHQP